ncbi:hypothetical protein CP532_3047 [Ophiocordyceps camponoti-leonardi (nom. inval.)]|nr:hypothetical protein CP532_3047 [Ophiocordyceps camponoti-leonardi (nom. inval.)]
MAVHDSPDFKPYTLHPRPPLIPGISDLQLSLICPIAINWLLSAGFELCDRLGWLSRYRLHTTAEELTRNRVTRRECLIVTIQSQCLQTILGLALGGLGEGDMTGFEDYYEAIWIDRVHSTLKAIFSLLSLSGVNFYALETKLSGHVSILSTPDHAGLEVPIGRFLYWYLVPTFQFVVTLVIADAFMFTIHRLEHTNRWLYKHIHAKHHRFYVPYAWAGYYNHPFDSLVVDGVSYAIGSWATGISIRLSIFLFSYASIKNVLDHCGFVFPSRLFRMITCTDADFHDVHHQSWGLKHNFGLYLSIWDRMMGSHFDDRELITRLRVKGRIAAEKIMSRAED